MKMLDWFRCYGESWGQELQPESYSHPAKFSRALIRRIYDHAIERGWLAEGDICIDPFAGVALGGLDAMFHGLHWVGVELEEKFVGLGQQNIDLWNSRYNNGMLPRWGTAVLLQGDSRELVGVLGEARVKACVSSPPYATKTIHGRGGLKLDRFKEPGRIGKTSHAVGECKMDDYGIDPSNLGNMREGDYAAAIVSSPPYISSISQSDAANDADTRIKRKAAAGVDVAKPVNIGGPNSVLRQSQVYGQSPGQLAAMAEGDVDAVIGSPPYAASATNGARENRGINLEQAGIDSKKWLGKRRCTQGRSEGYGQSPGQLATMPEGAFEATAVVSSPPWYGTTPESGDPDYAHKFHGDQSQYADSTLSLYNELTYMSPEWIGRRKQEAKQQRNISRLPAEAVDPDYPTFWSAARRIVQQCHQVLVPGGVAIWVLKSFVRNKQIVNFPDQWRQMCEACGFETLEWIRAWLVEDRGAQWALNGDLVEREVRRESFFRRLHRQKYPELSIDFEVVLVMRKAI